MRVAWCNTKNPILNERGLTEEGWGQALIAVLREFQCWGSSEPDVALSGVAVPQILHSGHSPAPVT